MSESREQLAKRLIGEVVKEEAEAIRAERDRYSYLLVRCRRELLSVLADIKRDRIPLDGDDFHELLRDLDAALPE